jgi:hypothetical protein
MTGKRQSDDNVSHVCRSEPNLGQKEAELEKASEAQLRHIEGDRATSAPGRFIAGASRSKRASSRSLS